MSMPPPPENLSTAPPPEAPLMTASYGTASGPRAGFWQRFGASFIDGIILFVPSLIVEAVFKSAGEALALLIAGAYFTYFMGRVRGQSPGQSALGIRVISFQDGDAIGYGRSLVRWIGSYLSAICLGLGYFWMLWDREKQCWHDKFAGSVVVPVSAYPPPPS